MILQLDRLDDIVVAKLANMKRNEIAYLKIQIQLLEGYVNGLKKNCNQQQQEEIQNKSYT